MNIALSTVFIFLVLLPGIVFRKFYYTEEFSKQYFKQNFFSVFFSSFVPSALIHILLSGVVGIFGYIVRLDLIGQMLTAKDFPENAFSNLQDNRIEVASYFIASVLIGLISGYFSKKIVRHFLWDTKYKLFRFRNAWHYIFSGEFFDFPRASFDLLEDEVENIDFVYVDALIESPEGSIIYDGALVDYELSNDGGLESITLKNAQRRMMNDDDKKNYYDIPGHILIIPYKSIINLNFSYYRLREIEGNEDEIEIIPELVK